MAVQQGRRPLSKNREACTLEVSRERLCLHSLIVFRFDHPSLGSYRTSLGFPSTRLRLYSTSLRFPSTSLRLYSTPCIIRLSSSFPLLRIHLKPPPPTTANPKSKPPLAHRPPSHRKSLNSPVRHLLPPRVSPCASFSTAMWSCMSPG